MHLNPSKLAAILLLVLIGFTSSAHAKSERTVSVMGTATTRAVPDMVVWKLTTTSINKNLATAKAESDRKIQAVLQAARSMGVAHQDLQTGQLAIQRIYDHAKFSTRRDIQKFRVTRELTITQRDIKRFDEILTRLIKASEMEVRYTLKSSKLTELRDQTRLKAVVAAQEKARAMAGALGAKIGRILTMTEENYRGGYNELLTNSLSWHENESSYGRQKSIPQDPATLAPGTIEVKVSVATVFELR